MYNNFKDAQQPRLIYLLQKNSKSVTQERLEIAEFIDRTHIFSYYELLQAFPKMGRASIFRSLNVFFEIGYIRKILVPQKAEYYEKTPEVGDFHEHLICQQCSGVESVELPQAFLDIHRGAREKDFQIIQYSVGILGICSKCK